MIKYLLALLLIATPAFAQWQTPNHSVPIGRGSGTGFNSKTPSTQGLPLTSQGPGVDPDFTAITTLALPLGVLNNVRVQQVGSSSLQTGDCGKTVVLGGNAFYTYTVGAAGGFNATCAVIILNQDGGNGKTISINGLSSFILWPGQEFILNNQNNVWNFNYPGHWSWGGQHTLFVCHSSGVKTFAVGGTSGAGMVASDSNDGLTINTPFATQQNAIQVLADVMDTNGFAPLVQNCNETFQENVNNNRTLTGYHIITFQGDTTTPGNVVHVCGANAVCQNARDYGISVVTGFKYCSNSACDNSTSGSTALMASQWGNIDYQKVDFGNFNNGNHVAILPGGGINFTGTSYTISGGTGGGAHVYCNGPGHYTTVGGSPVVNLPNAGNTIGNFYQLTGASCQVSIDPSLTFTGAGAGSGTTGTQYYSDPRSFISLNGVVPPGSTGGSACIFSGAFAFTCNNASSFMPQWILQNSTNDNTAAYLIFQKDFGGSASQNGNALGNVLMKGFASGAYQNSATFFCSQSGAVSGTNVPSACAVQTSTSAGQLNINFKFPPTNGANGNVLQSDGSGNTSWVAPAGSATSGNLVLLNTLTASVSSTLTDTTSFTNTYAQYKITFQDLVPGTNAVNCRIRVNQGGVQTTTYLASTEGANTGGTNLISTETTFIMCSDKTASNQHGTATPGISGECLVNDPSNTLIKHVWKCSFYYKGSNGTVGVSTNGGGFYDGAAGAVTGFEISESTGTIATGTVKVFGIVNWLLKRDIDPASNDNTPLGLATVG